MTFTKRLKFWAARMRREEDGATSVEFVMMAPLLAWAFLSTVTYFHAYRSEAISQKASLTIADMISREADFITPDYITGAHELLKFLTIEDANPDLRITAVRYNANNGKYRRVWSQERGPRSGLSHSGVDALAGQLPVMTHNERAIIVETWTEYEAPRNVGLNDFDMKTFTVISPRFVDRICYSATPDAADPNEKC